MQDSDEDINWDKDQERSKKGKEGKKEKETKSSKRGKDNDRKLKEAAFDFSSDDEDRAS